MLRGGKNGGTHRYPKKALVGRQAPKAVTNRICLVARPCLLLVYATSWLLENVVLKARVPKKLWPYPEVRVTWYPA